MNAKRILNGMENTATVITALRKNLEHITNYNLTTNRDNITNYGVTIVKKRNKIYILSIQRKKKKFSVE